MNQDLKNLLDHIGESANAINADLETGSHHRNNEAAKQFTTRYPELMRWFRQLHEFADKLDTETPNPPHHERT